MMYKQFNIGIVARIDKSDRDDVPTSFPANNTSTFTTSLSIIIMPLLLISLIK